MRRYRRFLLLVVLPIVAVIGGVVFDIPMAAVTSAPTTPMSVPRSGSRRDISGRIDKVVVKEGQLVDKGDVLFEIDRFGSACRGLRAGRASNRPRLTKRQSTLVRAPISRFTTRWPT